MNADHPCLRHDLYRNMQASFPALPAPEIYGPAAEGDVLAEITAPIVKGLPAGFQRLAMNHKLPLELLRALSRASELLTERSRQSPSPVTSQSGDISADSHLHYGFWTACPSFIPRRASSEVEPEISNLLSLGLWLYVAMDFSSLSIFETLQHWVSTAIWMRQDLTNKLRLCVEIRSDDEEDCLKWLTNVAIQSWRDPRDELQPDGISLNAFRKRRFPWFDSVDEGFFPFTKGFSLDSPHAGSRVHRGLKTRSRVQARSSRKASLDENQSVSCAPG